MLIHAAAFAILSLRRDVHVAFPAMFLVAGAVLMRKSREASPPRDPR
jgi:hypothetical protein